MSALEIQGEIWRPIPGYEGAYEASNLGRVRGLDRVVVRSDGMKTAVKGAVLQPKIWRGYERVGLRADGKQKLFKVHRLVCAAFHGPAPFEGALARHLNDVRRDNRPENLAWGTGKDNTADMRRNGRMAQGETHPYAKLTDADVVDIRASRLAGCPTRSLADRYGIHRNTVLAIANGQHRPEAGVSA